MVLQELDILDSGILNKKTDKNYLNINLINRFDKVSGEVTKGIAVGNHIIVQKVFEKGYENIKPKYTIYSCLVRYKGQEVGFPLFDKDHEFFASCGGVDDNIMIAAEEWENKEGKKGVNLRFSLVE